jgi:hypothetical protein
MYRRVSDAHSIHVNTARQIGVVPDTKQTGSDEETEHASLSNIGWPEMASLGQRTCAWSTQEARPFKHLEQGTLFGTSKYI